MIGHYGAAQSGGGNKPGVIFQDLLSPFTGQAAQTQAGEGFQSIVQALPNIQSTVHQLANPTTLVALSRRQAKLQQKISVERNPTKRAALQAELGVVQSQLAQLQAALQQSSTDSTTAVSVRPVSTISYGWIIAGVTGLLVIGGGLVLATSKKRRRR